MITKLVSGGQTGADIAALDVALQHNLPHPAAGDEIPGRLHTDAGQLVAEFSGFSNQACSVRSEE